MKPQTKSLALEVLKSLGCTFSPKQRERNSEDSCWSVSGTLSSGVGVGIHSAPGTGYSNEAKPLNIYCCVPDAYSDHRRTYYGNDTAPVYSGTFAITKGAERIAKEFTARCLPGGLAIFQDARDRFNAHEVYLNNRRNALQTVADVVPGAKVESKNTYGQASGEPGRVWFPNSVSDEVCCEPACDNAIKLTFSVSPEIGAALVKHFLALKSAASH